MKDAKGHGSNAKGAHASGIERLGQAQTRIGFYSLEPHNFRQPVGQPIVQDHSTPVDAMRYINRVIEGNGHPQYPKGQGAVAGEYHVVLKGERMPVNEAYRRTFGEEPRMSSRGYKYPRLGRSK